MTTVNCFKWRYKRWLGSENLFTYFLLANCAAVARWGFSSGVLAILNSFNESLSPWGPWAPLLDINGYLRYIPKPLASTSLDGGLATIICSTCSVKLSTILEFFGRGGLLYEVQKHYLDYLSRDRQFTVLETGRQEKPAGCRRQIYTNINKRPTAKYGIKKDAKYEDRLEILRNRRVWRSR